MFIATFRSLFEVPAGIDCQHHLFHKIAWSKFCCINMSSRPLNPFEVLLISYMNPYHSVWWPAMDMLQRWNFHPQKSKKISWGPFSYHNLSHDLQCPLRFLQNHKKKRFRHRAEVLGHCPFGTLQGIHLWILIFWRRKIASHQNPKWLWVLTAVFLEFPVSNHLKWVIW